MIEEVKLEGVDAARSNGGSERGAIRGLAGPVVLCGCIGGGSCSWMVRGVVDLCCDRQGWPQMDTAVGVRMDRTDGYL